MTAPTTTSADPFAAVQVPAAAAAASAAPARDAFTPATDSADPFAVSSDFRGDFIPSPGIESLAGRLVVMIPRKLDPNAPDPNNPGQTREVYTVDLTVLDGGKLEYIYKEKADPESADPARRMDQLKTWTVEEVSPASPFQIPGYWVPQGGLIGRLKKAHASAAPFLGVPAMVPTKAQRDKGVTAAQVRQEYAQWVQMGRQTARPKYTWAMDDPTSAQRAVAVAWWSTARATIPAITPA